MGTVSLLVAAANPPSKKYVDLFLVDILSASAGKCPCRDARKGKHRKDIRFRVAKDVLNFGALQVAKRQSTNHHALFVQRYD